MTSPRFNENDLQDKRYKLFFLNLTPSVCMELFELEFFKTTSFFDNFSTFDFCEENKWLYLVNYSLDFVFIFQLFIYNRIYSHEVSLFQYFGYFYNILVKISSFGSLYIAFITAISPAFIQYIRLTRKGLLAQLCVHSVVRLAQPDRKIDPGRNSWGVFDVVGLKIFRTMHAWVKICYCVDKLLYPGLISQRGLVR